MSRAPRPPRTDEDPQIDNLKPWILAGVIATAAIVMALPLYVLRQAVWRPSSGGETAATFVGREECKSCHKDAYDKWTGSHHDKAMEVASEETILGDFDDATYEYDGVTTRFYRKEKKFIVQTPGPGGEPGDFEVAYTFGFYPLQQYMVEFPGGRIQCLTIAWDDVQKEWYALPNHVSDPEDWLFWTNAGASWNAMCSECHSTHVSKDYNLNTDTYQTSWAEIDVSCEACHGPASRHMEWAKDPAMGRTDLKDYGLEVKSGVLTTDERWS